MKIRKVEIQQMVVEQTREMIVTKGLKGLNMVGLANKTGLAKQTLYRIIGTKEKAIERVVLYQMEQTFGYMNRIIGENPDFSDFITKFLAEAPAFLSKVPRVTLPEIFREYPSIEKNATEHQKELAGPIIAFFRKAMTEGQLRDDISPEFLFDLARGGVLEHYIRSGLTGEKLQTALALSFKCLFEGTMRRD